MLQNHHLVFPRTPIEVELIHDVEYKSLGTRYQIFVGGVWECWEATYHDVITRLSELKRKYAEDNWSLETDRQRFRPNWGGWHEIDRYYQNLRNQSNSN